MNKHFFFFFLIVFNVSIFAQPKIDSVDYYMEKNELIKGLNYAKTKSEYYFKKINLINSVEYRSRKPKFMVD